MLQNISQILLANQNNNYSSSLKKLIINLFLFKLNLTFNQDSISTGEQASLLVKTQPNSIVSVCVIDQSVELLGKKMNHLNKDYVEEYLNRLNLNPYYAESFTNDFGFRNSLRYPFYRINPENLQELQVTL
jgi:hypothetical protein